MTSTVFPAPAVLETAAPVRRLIEASGAELQIYEWGDRSQPPILLAHGIQDFALTLAPVAPATLVADAAREPASATGSMPAPASARTGSLASRAQAHYTRAIRAQRNGDWALYGAELERLGAVLEELRAGESEN